MSKGHGRRLGTGYADGYDKIFNRSTTKEGTTMERINSPRTDDNAIEAQIQAKGLTAPRIKPEDITANIADTEFVTHVAKSGQVLRWAILTTQSGFAVVGKPSVSVSPANDDEQIGRSVAYENSRNEMWPLMGYELKQRMHVEGTGLA